MWLSLSKVAQLLHSFIVQTTIFQPSVQFYCIFWPLLFIGTVNKGYEEVIGKWNSSQTPTCIIWAKLRQCRPHCWFREQVILRLGTIWCFSMLLTFSCCEIPLCIYSVKERNAGLSEIKVTFMSNIILPLDRSAWNHSDMQIHQTPNLYSSRSFLQFLFRHLF